MTATRLFRMVWRINGVLVLLAFLATGGAMIVAAIAATDWGWDRRAGAPDVPAPGEEDVRLDFGSAERVEGTAYVVLPLRADGRSSSYSSDDRAETRNLLFYDVASGATRWLQPDHRTVVATHELLREGDGEDSKAPVTWIRYELEDADKDGGGERVSIGVSGPGGENAKTVLRAVDEVLGYSGVRDGRVVVFFRQGGEALAAEIDLSARKVLKRTKLPRS